MSEIKKKYKKEDIDILDSIIKEGRHAAVLEVKVVGCSKIQDHLIYQCVYIHAKKLCETYIIARDITDAMKRLEPFVESGSPEAVVNHILGSERY